MDRKRVFYAAQAACLLEVSTPKPGNVNKKFNFHDVTFEDFLLSSMVIGRYMENAHLVSVGETVLNAVEETQKFIGSNTNLGIILLLTPLAKAYGNPDLRFCLHGVLSSLTVDDSKKVYRAIRLATPGGIGNVSQADVREDPEITLYESMQLARERDTIAREYTTCYEVTFELGKPYFESLLAKDQDFISAIVQTYLKILAEVPDTLIVRKAGREKAIEVSEKAADILRLGGTQTEEGKKKTEDLDRFLRSEGNRLNPGTTADLIAAILFLFFLENGVEVWKKYRLRDRRQLFCG